MKYKDVEVVDQQVISKINNFVRTCERLTQTEKNVETSQQAVIALKVLMRFLKNKQEYAIVYEKFGHLKTIADSYEEARKLCSNGYIMTMGKDDNHGSPNETDTVACAYSVGDKVSFGHKSSRNENQEIRWTVIRAAGTMALLFPEKVLFWEEFDKSGDTVWSKSSLFQTLSKSWIIESFTDEEIRSNLLFEDVEVEGVQQPRCKVMSVDEITLFLPDNEARKDRVATWWTSTPGANPGTLIIVNRNGELLDDDFSSKRKNGVRPIIWINAAKVVETSIDNNCVITRSLLIVHHTDGYFFIIEPQHNEEVSSAFILRTANDAQHYATEDEAMQAAKRLQMLLETPTVHYELKTIVLSDLIKDIEEKQDQDHTIFDKSGNEILRINTKGKITLSTREEDADTRFIDKHKYQEALYALMCEEKEKLCGAFDYYSLGRIQGLEVGMDCRAASIRFEVYKAEEMIESFIEDGKLDMLFSEDEKFLRGYISALEESVALQRQCSLGHQTWIIRIIVKRGNADDINIPDVDGFIPELGSYQATVYQNVPEKCFSPDCRYVYVVFVDNSIEWIETNTRKELELPSNVDLVFRSEKQKMNAARIVKLVKTVIIHSCSLGAGDPAYTISPEFVPAISEFESYFEDDSEDIIEDETSESYKHKIKKVSHGINVKNEDELEPYGFCSMIELKEIKLPISAKTLPRGLFKDCVSLVDVLMPQALKEIQESAFEGCVSLWRIFLPETVTTLGDRAFYGCTSLRKVYLPNSLCDIGSECFGNCSKLTTIHFPPSIKTMACDAFDGCDELLHIDVPEGLSLCLNGLRNIEVTYYKVPKKKQTDKHKKTDINYAISESAQQAQCSPDKPFIAALQSGPKQFQKFPETMIELLEQEDKHGCV